jgi:hypothetical protein
MLSNNSKYSPRMGLSGHVAVHAHAVGMHVVLLSLLHTSITALAVQLFTAAAMLM